MTSSKPYLVRALYEWILDNGNTPHILVDTAGDLVSIPAGIDTDGKVVLNLAPQAVQNLEMANDHVSFSARFGGVAQDIYCPMTSLLAIYARENGEGMMFPPGDGTGGDDGDAAAEKSKGPALRVIK